MVTRLNWNFIETFISPFAFCVVLLSDTTALCTFANVPPASFIQQKRCRKLSIWTCVCITQFIRLQRFFSLVLYFPSLFLIDIVFYYFSTFFSVLSTSLDECFGMWSHFKLCLIHSFIFLHHFLVMNNLW